MINAAADADTLASLVAKGYVVFSNGRVSLTEQTYELIATEHGFLGKSDDLTWEALCRAAGLVPLGGGSLPVNLLDVMRAMGLR